MTFTLNGVGTTLSGDRWLTIQELNELIQHEDFKEVIQVLKENEDLDIKEQEDLFRFKIATKSFSIFFLPIIPLETFIYYCPKTKWYDGDKYIPLFYTKGEGKVDWNHVKHSWSFYLFPILIFLIILFNILN